MWNRSILMILIVLLSVSQLMAQRDYADYNQSQLTDVLYEDFADNRNKWFEGYERKGKRRGSIQDGYYAWQSKSDMYNEHATWKNVPFQQYRDFEIETRIKFVQGNPREKSTALSWGRSDQGSFFFGFKGNEFYISRWGSKIGGLDLYADKKTSYLNQGDYNTLTVRKTDNIYHFYINERLVHTMPFEKFYGTNVGFESTNLIHVDYLRISYLDETSTTSRPPISQVYDEVPDQQQASDVSETELPKQNALKKQEENNVALAQNDPTEVNSSSVPESKARNDLEEDNSKGESSEVVPSKNAGDLPIITITEPVLSRGFKQIAVQKIRIAGNAVDQDGIQQVLINGKPAWLRPDGQFSLETDLHVGDNEFEIVATDRNQQSTTNSFSIRREEASQEKRLALVIGNSNYSQGGQLRNPINDADAMEVTLENLGFTVLKYENCQQNDIKRAIDEFGQKLKDYEVGLFFYAGHGVQVNGSNYLIPVDAQLTSAYDVEYDCVRADRVLAKMEAANSQTNIVMLDACRDNPFERSWSRSTRGNGLAFMSAPRGSLVAYATAPGQTASDGGGQHGIYTEALLQHLTTPNITIEQVFKRVRATVSQNSEGKQIPWESTSLTGDFYFQK